MSGRRTFLALGSNVGDRDANLRAAHQELTARGVKIVRQSTIRETDPVGVTEQPRFLNQVLEVDWPGDARELLAITQAVESAVGRTPTYRWGPRVIDVDILMVGDDVVDEPDLQVPHPRLRERAFVLEPLSELMRESA